MYTEEIMGKMERRMLLQSTKGMTVNLDPDTHRAIKAWAHQEGITIVHAIRLMATAFFKSQTRKQPEEEQTDPIVKEKLLELASAVRKAQEKPKISENGTD